MLNTIANDGEFGGRAHYMNIDTEGSNDNGTMIDAQAYVGVSGWFGYIG